jgi:IS30 family transposase
LILPDIISLFNCDAAIDEKSMSYKHLTKDERKSIERMLASGNSIKDISLRLDRNVSTISREIFRNSQARQTGCIGSAFNNCVNRKSCVQFRLCKKEDCKRQTCCGCKFCFRLCPDFERESCVKLKSPPYVCNGCSSRYRCTLEKFVYEANPAHRSYKQILTDSRTGIALSNEELERINKIVSPLLKKGQSIYAICQNHKDTLMLDRATLYTYVKAGLLTAEPLDLLRMVKMKPRQKKKEVKVEAGCRTGRTYRDFLEHVEVFDPAVVQIDSVIGKQGDKENVLLTIHFTASELLLIYRRDSNTARTVIEIFDNLYEDLGHDTFTELFPVILTDNGSEFSQPSAIEFTKDGVQRTKIFYCDPGAAWQKGSLENNHSLIRRIIPKGTSFNDFSQSDFELIASHINSYPRKKLKGNSAFLTFSFLHRPLSPETLGVSIISHDDVMLTPMLLKK